MSECICGEDDCPKCRPESYDARFCRKHTRVVLDDDKKCWRCEEKHK
jgi:hypothetical protein